MVECGILPEKAISRWRCCLGEEFPSEDRTKIVVFQSFYEKGFPLPAGAFFCGLHYFYGVEVTHLKPNSIMLIAILFICARGNWASPRTSTCDGHCTASRGTRPMTIAMWWEGRLLAALGEGITTLPPP